MVRADCERLGVEPPMPVDDAAAMILAMDNGYLLSEMIEPGSVYFASTDDRNCFRLGFSSIDQAKIDPGLERLARLAGG